MSPAFSRVIAVALLVLVLVSIWRFAMLPVWNMWRVDREAIEDSRDAIARFKGLAATRDSLLKQLEATRSNPALEGALMNASTATLAAAQLQQQLKATVETAGGSLVSSQVMDGEADGPFVKVRVNVRMTLSIAELQQVLYELESQRPVLVVDELLILSRSATRRRRNAGPEARDLDVRARLSGYMTGSVEDTDKRKSARPRSSSKLGALASRTTRR